MVTGAPGMGKTQLVKSFIDQLPRYMPLCVLDFKRDFGGDVPLLEAAGIQTRDVGWDGLGFNPMAPEPIQRDGQTYIWPEQHLAGIAGALQQSLGLGAQQVEAVRMVMRQAYQAAGVTLDRHPRPDHEVAWPLMSELSQPLQAADPAAHGRLSQLLTREMFSERDRKTTLGALLNDRMVFDFKGVNAEHTRNALASLILYAMQVDMRSQPHDTNVRRFLVVDEAHRALGLEALVNLVREGRAFGLGVLLASQAAGDFSRGDMDYPGMIGTKIVYSNGADHDAVRAVSRLLGLPEGREAEIRQIKEHQAFISLGTTAAVLRASVLGWVHWKVLQALRQARGPSGEALERFTLDQLGMVAHGVDRGRLPEVCAHLQAMRLVREEAGLWQVI